jgi:hypothetical protein
MHNEQLRDFLETLACVGDEYPSTRRSSSVCNFPGLVTRNAVLILSVIIMERSPSWQADSNPVVHKVPRLLWKLMFVTMFTASSHWTTSQVRWTQSKPLHLFKIRRNFNIIIPSTSRSSNMSLSFRFTEKCVYVSHLPYECYMSHPSHTHVKIIVA